MAAYIIRRLFAAVVLLLVVSMVTFAIFFLVPQLAGADPDHWPPVRRARRRPRGASQAVKQKLGLDEPLYVQYWHFVKGIVAGANYDYGPDVTHVPAALLRLLLHATSRRSGRCSSTACRSRSRSRSARRSSGWSAVWPSASSPPCERGSVFDRAAMGVALAGVSLPIFFTGLLSLASSRYQLGCGRTAQLRAVHREPGGLGLRT